MSADTHINEGNLILSERRIRGVMLSDTSDTANHTPTFMYEQLTDLNNLCDAFKRSRKGVDWKGSVQRYEASMFANAYKTSKALADGTYRQKPFVEFDICERGKRRHIKSLHISDRVVQRALCDYILVPVLMPYLIYDNGASIEGKGISFARRRIKVHLQRYYRKHGNKGYVLMIDFRHFFDSIPHEKLMAALAKHIDDERILSLMRYMIDTFGGRCGVGIGSQISQIAGIYYPSRIDDYCKTVRGCKYYGRYMDDIYIIHESKDYLKSLLEDIKAMAKDMELEINEHKTQLFRIDKGFTFLKIRYALLESGRILQRPCRTIFARERRKLKRLKAKLDKGEIAYKDIESAYKSWKGNLRKFDCRTSLKKADELYQQLFGDCYDNRNNSKSEGHTGNTRRVLQRPNRVGSADKVQLRNHRDKRRATGVDEES